MKSLNRQIAMLVLGCSAGLSASGQSALRDGHDHDIVASFDKAATSGPRHVKASLLAHPDGHLYGTSTEGGTHNQGTAFRVSPDGTVTVLHHFEGTYSNHSSNAPLVLGSNGYLYGTTQFGGANGSGTAFRLGTDGSFQVLVEFRNAPKGGSQPKGGLIEGPDGHFYGVTGSGGGIRNCGTLFRMAPGGRLTVLHRFEDSFVTGGCHPEGLVDGGDGYLYGVSRNGGQQGIGMVYRFSYSGQLQPLNSLLRDAHGAGPKAPLTMDANGQLFGATSTAGPEGSGTVFTVSRDGTLGVIASLSDKLGWPAPAKLLAASDNGLYLVTRWGKNHPDGAILRVDKALGQSVVHSFRAPQTREIEAGLAEGADGLLYGATQAGQYQRGRYGTVYSLTMPPGR